MLIIKIGGGESINLEGVVADLAELEQPYLVVHGANALRDEIAERMGTPKQVLTSVSGYSSVYSDAPAIDAILMAYAGLRNKRLVELCQRRGINAVGLTGLDGRIVEGERNRGIRVREGGKTLIKRDFSGKPRRLNKALLQLLLDNGYAPVLSIPIADEQGFAINSENDDIVALLQDSFRADCIVQLIEAAGFLDDEKDPESLVTSMSRLELERREEQVQGRMKRKMLSLRRLFEAGETRVIIADGRVEHPVHDALAGKGTTIQ